MLIFFLDKQSNVSRYEKLNFLSYYYHLIYILLMRHRIYVHRVLFLQATEKNHVDINVYRYIDSQLDTRDDTLVYFEFKGEISHLRRTSKVDISTFKYIAFPSGVLRS